MNKEMTIAAEPNSDDYKVMIARLFKEAFADMTVLDRVAGNCYVESKNWKRISKRGSNPVVRIFKNIDGDGYIAVNQTPIAEDHLSISFELCEREPDPNSIFPMWVKRAITKYYDAKVEEIKAAIPKPKNWGEFA